MKFLIVDGYPESARADLREAGAATGGELYERMLRENTSEAEVTVSFPADEPNLPEADELKSYGGILWTGCNLCIHALDDDRVDRQIELARRAFAAGVPQFGSCWAIQIAAVAAGGKVEANPRGREMGLARKIRLTEAGRRHPMYRDKPPVFDAFICHLDEVTELPEGSTLLAGNDFTAVQALEVRHLEGSFWGVQYHPEYDLTEMARLTQARRSPLLAEGFFDSEDEIDRHLQRLHDLAQNPDSKALRWSLAIDEDVLSPTQRQRELINWLAFIA